MKWIFETGEISLWAACSLATGNIFIAYTDIDDSNKAKFSIRGPTGTIIKGSTIFEGSGVDAPATCAEIGNGNIVVAWDEYSTSVGKFIIYTPTGDVAVAETSFATSVNGARVTALSNGNFMIAYGRFIDGTLNIVIYDNTGALISGPTACDTDVSYNNFFSQAIVTLANTNVFIFYSYSNLQKFIIRAQDGSAVAGPTSISFGDHLRCALTSTGTVFMVYSNSNVGKLKVVDSGGSETVAEKTFAAAINSETPCCALRSDNNLNICYHNTVTGSGEVVTYSAVGNLVTAAIQFETNGIEFCETVWVTVGGAGIYRQGVLNEGWYTTFLAPTKAANPVPTDTDTGILLDGDSIDWDASSPYVADTYNVYFGESGSAVLVSNAQAGVTWDIPFPTLEYGVTYEWRVDATNVFGITTGDTWTFTALTFIEPGSGAGPGSGIGSGVWIRRLVAVAANKLWYENI